MNKIKVFFTKGGGRTSPVAELTLLDALNKGRRIAVENNTAVTVNIYLPSSPQARKFLVYDGNGYIKGINPQVKFM